MVLPLGDRFESKEKLKHFDKAALGSQSPGMSLWVWPWEQPPAGGAWALRVQLEDPRVSEHQHPEDTVSSGFP